MKRYKALKMRIYPTDEQVSLIRQTFGSCRFIYNHMLERYTKVLKRKGRRLSRFDMQYLLPGMKNYLPWLADVDQSALKYACRNVDDALRRCASGQNNFSRFKSKRFSKQSYTTTQMQCVVYDHEAQTVILPVLGCIKCSEKRVLKKECRFLHATVSCQNGKYYASLLYEYEEDIRQVQITDEKQVCGLDYKSDGLYVSSKGECPHMPHYFRKAEKKLLHEQRKLSHMIESHIIGYQKTDDKTIPVYDRPLYECRNVQKQRAVVSRIHEHIANQRNDWLNKCSKDMADRYDAVCAESINMKEISNKESGLGKSTMDNGYGSFLTKLSYKLEDRGKRLIKVGRYYPSSQRCCTCGYVDPAIKDLSIRWWTCPACGADHNRDVNAAINIKHEGLRILGLS